MHPHKATGYAGRSAAVRTGAALAHAATPAGRGLRPSVGLALATLLVFALWQAASGRAAGSWRAAGNLSSPRSGQTATVLNDGTVLVVSGPSAERYYPAQGAWTQTGSPNVARSSHTTTLLADGRVLVAGGCCSPADPQTDLATAEIFDPAPDAGTPSDDRFKASDHGSHTFTFTLSNAGTQSVIVTDVNNDGLNGRTTVAVTP